MVDGHPMKGRAFVGANTPLFVDFPDALACIGEINATLPIHHDPRAGMSEARERKAEESSKDHCGPIFHGITVTLCIAVLVSKK
jgi:hypothetical protein